MTLYEMFMITENLLQDVYYHEQLLLMPYINQYPKPVIMTLAKLAVHDLYTPVCGNSA